MNAIQLLEKFPDLEYEGEDSHLNDMCCPECGYRNFISISVTTWMELFSDGMGEHEDTEWEQNSACKCRACNHDATVADFTFKGLDDLILEGIDE